MMARFASGLLGRQGGRPCKLMVGGDIPAAARALGVALADHVTVLARATAAVARIKAGTDAAPQQKWLI